MLLLLAIQISALEQAVTARYFNGPTIGSITESSATVSLSQAVLSGISNEEKPQIYFEYYETNQVCIAIYPTPEYCLPKKTKVGETSVTVRNLKPNTSYTVMYKRDNTIRCITIPCPSNDFTSASVEFATKDMASDLLIPSITKNLKIGSRGPEVFALQNLLVKKGYLVATPTGYYGTLTFAAVKKLQRDHNISVVGIVGPKTRELLARMCSVSHPDALTEKFEGIVTAYSTACFADGECSISVDGKKIVTTIGWSQQTVGEVRGISDFGSIESSMGARAKVYARKTADGYTLYGNSDYFIEITSKKGEDLQAKLMGSSWFWDKTNIDSGVTITPKQAGKFSLSFESDGRITGTTDCNSFFGNYGIENGMLTTFSNIGSTKMYCQDSQESLFITYLDKTVKLSIDRFGGLIMTLSDGSVVSFEQKRN